MSMSDFFGCSISMPYTSLMDGNNDSNVMMPEELSLEGVSCESVLCPLSSSSLSELSELELKHKNNSTLSKFAMFYELYE